MNQQHTYKVGDEVRALRNFDNTKDTPIIKGRKYVILYVWDGISVGLKGEYDPDHEPEMGWCMFLDQVEPWTEDKEEVPRGITITGPTKISELPTADDYIRYYLKKESLIGISQLLEDDLTNMIDEYSKIRAWNNVQLALKEASEKASAIIVTNKEGDDVPYVSKGSILKSFTKDQIV